ncbi:MAG: class II aldolase/adducin family protein [Thermomicrobiales bacterium]|nr:class II aldolase/adducin family protein [Thermomicrobiales bacterium]MCO5220272.1 class II aldolase/adducin family protein [Thermomicrobiales bacterium]
MLLEAQRRRVVEVGLEALRRGIVHGTAGNFSERERETGLIAISPSGIPYPETTIDDVVIVDAQGNVVEGKRRPSSETPMHTMVMRQFDHVDAIVHTHSHFATVVSTIRPYLPPILTETSLVVGARIPVTRYGLTAMEDIGESVVEAMTPASRAVIMRNHGLITFGQNFDQALLYSMLVEEAAEVYVQGLAANGGREPNLVPEELVDEMTVRFNTSYGQPAGER